MNLTKEQAIEQIHGRVLAIENDDKEATEKCLKIVYPDDKSNSVMVYKFYYQSENKGFWTCTDGNIDQAHIPATELLRILEGEWMPEVGKEYEFSDDGNYWSKRIFVTTINHVFKFIVISQIGVVGYKLCRPIQKKQISIVELFEKANLDINQYEVVK